MLMIATHLPSLHSPFKHNFQQNIASIMYIFLKFVILLHDWMQSRTILVQWASDWSYSFATFCMPYNFYVCLRDWCVGLTDRQHHSSKCLFIRCVQKCEFGIQMTDYKWEFIMCKSMGCREFERPKGQDCLYLALWHKEACFNNFCLFYIL